MAVDTSWGKQSRCTIEIKWDDAVPSTRKSCSDGSLSESWMQRVVDFTFPGYLRYSVVTIVVEAPDDCESRLDNNLLNNVSFLWLPRCNFCWRGLGSIVYGYGVRKV